MGISSFVVGHSMDMSVPGEGADDLVSGWLDVKVG